MVSVVVPIYNVEEYISKCLKSLENQTLKEIEIILVNDGSTENSGKIAKEYADELPQKFKYLEKKNGGLSDARNYGMKYVTGDYVAFLDSDDYVEKETYELLYKKAKEEDADYVECDFIWEYPNKEVVDRRSDYKTDREMLKNVRVVAWNKLIKTSILKKNKIEFPFGLRYEDIEFTYKLIPFLKKVAYVEKPLIHYMQRDTSIANVQTEKNKDIFEILDNVLEFYKRNDLYEDYKDELEYTYSRLLLCSSLKRISKIQDEKIREELSFKTWGYLNETFPEWKKNELLKKDKSRKAFYMRRVNKKTFRIFCKIISRGK